MYDGTDLQIGLYFLVVVIYLYFKSNYLHFFTPILIPLIFFLFFNFKKICFIGNSGSHFLGYLIGVIIIKFYNLNLLSSVEEVIIIMLIPGLDLIRLFFHRILNNKHFFQSDQNHIHHLLLVKNNKIRVQSTLVFLNISPIIIAELFTSYLLGVFYGIFIYLFVVLKKNN